MQAASSAVVDEIVLAAGDTEEVRELVDRQPDCRVLTNVVGVHVFMRTHLAASIGDRQRDAARVAGAGVEFMIYYL